MPAQQGPQGDNRAQRAPVTAGQQPGQRSQHRTVSPRQPGGLDLALEHDPSVAQDEDRVLRVKQQVRRMHRVFGAAQA